MVQNVLLAEWFVSNSNCFADCIISPLSFLKYKTSSKPHHFPSSLSLLFDSCSLPISGNPLCFSIMLNKHQNWSNNFLTCFRLNVFETLYFLIRVLIFNFNNISFIKFLVIPNSQATSKSIKTIGISNIV